MDVQHGIADDSQHGELLERLGRVVAGAREANVPVVYVTLAFRPGHPEVSDRNAVFAGIRDAGTFVEGESVRSIPRWRRATTRPSSASGA